MRGLLYLFTGVLLLVAACQQTSPPQQETKAPTQLPERTSTPTVSPLIEYQQFLAKLDSGDVTSVSKAADKYTSLFKGQPSSMADSGYVIFEKFYRRVDNTINEIHFQDSTDYKPLVLVYDEPNPLALTQKLKDYNNKMIANGFEVDMTEGATYLKQDRDFIAKHFYSFISPVLKEYLVQVNKDHKEGFSEDGGLTISPVQLADRVIWRENFLRKHPDFIFRKSAESERKSYLATLFEGMDNTPVLSFEDGKLDPSYAEAYQYLQKKAPQSPASKLIKPYFAALQKQDTSKANSLLTLYKLDGLVGY